MVKHYNAVDVVCKSGTIPPPADQIPIAEFRLSIVDCQLKIENRKLENRKSLFV